MQAFCIKRPGIYLHKEFIITVTTACLLIHAKPLFLRSKPIWFQYGYHVKQYVRTQRSSVRYRRERKPQCAQVVSEPLTSAGTRINAIIWRLVDPDNAWRHAVIAHTSTYARFIGPLRTVHSSRLNINRWVERDVLVRPRDVLVRPRAIKLLILSCVNGSYKQTAHALMAIGLAVFDKKTAFFGQWSKKWRNAHQAVDIFCIHAIWIHGTNALCLYITFTLV